MYKDQDLIKYYLIIVQGNARGGVLYAPSTWPRPVAEDGVEVSNSEKLIVELRDGDYRNFNMCVGHANIVSEEFKDAIHTIIADTSDLEFLPIQAHSTIYGDRKYYIMHFKKIFDVLDEKRTLYVSGTSSIIKPWVDYEKVKELDIFNFRPLTNDVIISERVKKLLCKLKLNDGIEFQPVFCYHKS